MSKHAEKKLSKKAKAKAKPPNDCQKDASGVIILSGLAILAMPLEKLKLKLAKKQKEEAETTGGNLAALAKR